MGELDNDIADAKLKICCAHVLFYVVLVLTCWHSGSETATRANLELLPILRGVVDDVQQKYPEAAGTVSHGALTEAVQNALAREIMSFKFTFLCTDGVAAQFWGRISVSSSVRTWF